MPTICKDPVDITFVVDGSVSAAYNSHGGIQHSLKLVNQFVNNYIIGPQNTRVGLVVFASEGQTVFKFESHATKESLLQDIAKIKLPQTISFLSKGLQQAKDEVGSFNKWLKYVAYDIICRILFAFWCMESNADLSNPIIFSDSSKQETKCSSEDDCNHERSKS